MTAEGLLPLGDESSDGGQSPPRTRRALRLAEVARLKTAMGQNTQPCVFNDLLAALDCTKRYPCFVGFTLAH